MKRIHQIKNLPPPMQAVAIDYLHNTGALPSAAASAALRAKAADDSILWCGHPRAGNIDKHLEPNGDSDPNAVEVCVACTAEAEAAAAAAAR